MKRISNQIHGILLLLPISRGANPNCEEVYSLNTKMVTFVLSLLVALLAEIFAYWLNNRDK